MAKLPCFNVKDGAGSTLVQAQLSTVGGNVDVLGNEPSVSKVYSPTARLPRKLVSKIQNLEFIEMSELLPEAWISDAVDDSVGQKSRRRAPISEIYVWVECLR